MSIFVHGRLFFGTNIIIYNVLVYLRRGLEMEIMKI